jgi:LuxR family maltose regulon positive regulatory protein
MSAQLLKTKFFIPKPPIHTVSRPGLQERLDRALDCKLTLLAAPAGFGKTTLMSCWIQEQSPNAAWISLDGDDNDATQFWAYVTRALQQVCVNWKVSLLPEFNPIQPPPTQTLLTHLINQLTDIDQQMVLVLDDYHVISNQDIHRDLAF